jgi:DnaJ-class molecular chaperone
MISYLIKAFWRWVDEQEACKRCNGHGEISLLVRGGTNWEARSATCPDCKGSGSGSPFGKEQVS